MEEKKKTVWQVISEKKEDIMKAWMKEVKKQIPEAHDINKVILKNTIPDLLDSLTKALEADDSRKIYDHSESHGKNRAMNTSFAIEQVVKEYRILKTVIFNILDDSKAEIKLKDQEGINYAVDQAIQQAVKVFHLNRYEETQGDVEKTQVMVDDLKKLGIFRDQFIVSLNHDLKNPLGNILTAVELLEEVIFKKDPYIDNLLGIIKSSTLKSNKLINNLLDVSRISNNEPLPLDTKSVNIVDVIEHSVDGLRQEVQKITDFQKPDGEIICTCDDVLVIRAVDNLVSNAYKYGDRSAITIAIDKDNSENYVNLMIHNTGDPIAEADQDKIFDPYFRSENSNTKGHGLGLTLVKGIAEAHNGDVKVRSSSTEGTTFTFLLPCGQ